MIFTSPYKNYPLVQTNPEDIKDLPYATGMPYDTPSEIDKEVMLWKYYRLNNLPKHLYQIKVGRNFLFGHRVKN